MSNTKHTSTPWFAKRESWSTVYIEARIGGGILQEVAACGPTEAGSEQQDANAAFIVRACNSHEQLVAALRGLLAATDAYSTVHAPDGDDAARMVEYAEALNKARAALAAAEAA